MKQKYIDVPKWNKDLNIYNNIKSSFILEGNIHDLQPFVNVEKQICYFVSLNDYLFRYLSDVGYDLILYYNKIDGFHNDFSKRNIDLMNEVVSRDEKKECDLLETARIVKELLENEEYTVSIVFDVANTLTGTVEMLNENELYFYTSLLLLSKKRIQNTSSKNGNRLTNHIFFISDKSNDIPVWFYNNNPYVEIMYINETSNEYRRNFLFNSIKRMNYELNDLQIDKEVEYISNISSGMSNLDLHGLFVIAKTNNYRVDELPRIINRMKYGESNSPWRRINKDRIKNADVLLKERVKGQDQIIERVKKILIRSVLDFNSENKTNNKPKGIMFFAGPTGTGKTEMAKAIAELLFYDEMNIIRFDMSEYSESHSDQKLFGAPPGYVGYETGGQLTNAVKNRPFSILLFDEIDKAHPSIMDKFLQILDEGRMTDGQGNTVYFSESLIIFTSNIGTQRKSKDINGNATIKSLVNFEDSYQKINDVVIDELKNTMRPEIINRIGNNILVFDFIREQGIDLILKKQMNEFTNIIKEKYLLDIEYTDRYYNYLREKSKETIEYGGRGIRNIIETYLINYVSPILFSNDHIKRLRLDFNKVVSYEMD